MEGCAVEHISELLPCTFAPNSVGGGRSFLCIETATGYSVHSQRAILSLAATEGDLELYRHLIGWSEGDLAAAIDMDAEGDTYPTLASIANE